MYLVKGAGELAYIPDVPVGPAATQNRQKSMEARHSQMKEQGGPIHEEDVVMQMANKLSQ
jgi:hypothetical protein